MYPKDLIQQYSTGSNVTLYCMTSASTVQWHRERRMKPDTAVVTYEGNYSSLTISNVQLNDSGIYYCQYQTEDFGPFVFITTKMAVSVDST